MVSGRPLLYLSLPGLALIIGLVWFRRKKFIGFDSGGDATTEFAPIDNNSSLTKTATDAASAATNKINECIIDVKQTESLPITPSIVKHQSAKNQSSSSSSSSCSGKSAPIDIVTNTRSPPKFSDQQLDAELLKLKIEESDIRNLRLIEEQDDYSSFESPVNLPGTVDRYQNFNRFNKSLEPQVEPVVVKASMAAKISPKNSFATDLSTVESELKNLSVGGDAATNHDFASTNQDVVANNSSTSSHPVLNCATKENTITNNSASRPNSGVVKESVNNSSDTGSHSPALSVCSMHSGDSGKGSSPPQSECAPLTSYEFLLPVYLVSKLLGRKAGFVQRIKIKTGVNVLIKRNPETHKNKICSLDGTQAEIDKALVLIRKKFPEKRFSALTLQRVDVGHTENVVPLPLVDSTCLSLQLVEGINNDVAISSIVSGGHVFLQQPLHPSFLALNTMQQCLIQSYSTIETPPLPEITQNAICVATVQGSWYRVQIVSQHSDVEHQYCLVKYLDHGGYANVPVANLRQIRADFMVVPFQSIECVLSNVKPSDESGWSNEASEVLYNLTKDFILQAQVAGYTVEGLPEIFLFASLARDNVIFINQELAARGLAKWVE